MLALIICELKNGKLKSTSLELVTACAQAKITTECIVLGTGASGAQEVLAKHGATKLYFNEDKEFDNYHYQLLMETISPVAKEQNPKVILGSASSSGRDFLPRLAAKLDFAFASDCVSLEIGASIKVKKPFYSGKCTGTLSFNKNCIVVMRPNQLPIKESATQIQVVQIPKAQIQSKITLIEVRKGLTEKPDLTEASTIVSGGRGMKGPEHFKLLEDLANILGATVGASRAVVDAGWVSHSMQVGQTGKTVAPSLYIACGISGAIQHLAGMSSSKVVVAINKDKDAPIFKKSTYGIVGDVFEVLPKLIESSQKLLGK